jgi:SEC-C motif-containing protein
MRMMTSTPRSKTCPCGSGKVYSECCELYHDGLQIPATAELLMRSRFTAYALRNADYLLLSWDESKRPDSINFSKETAEWQRLQIISSKKGSAKDSKGRVEFKAFYCQDGEDCFMHEISRFVKIGGHWRYLDGVIKAAGKVEGQRIPGKKFT